MRKCLRCGTEMQEDCTLYGGSFHDQVLVGERGKLFPKMRKLCCAVCPQCGYVELYVEDLKGD